VIERALFGRTGHASTRVIFGAAALWSMNEERAARVLATLDDFGINHIDTAADYGDSELALAPWLRTRRDDFFLGTKTADRTGDGARRSLERSLGRLGVDHVDLIQLHNLVEEDEWETAHGPGGAVDALRKARDEGLTRFIGVTGHGLRIAGMHARSLERFDFDSVLLPYNWTLRQNDDYRADVEALLSTCAERNVAVQTIKSVARRRWEDDSTAHFSWYEPLADDDARRRAVRYVLARPQLFLNTSSDARVLRPILEAADAAFADGTPTSPTDEEMEADALAQGIRPLFDGAALERI